jgi:excisionase family DNA binding protein
MIICEGIAIIFGAIMLFTGKITLGKVRRQGRNVRLAGLVLMLPLVVGVMATVGLLMQQIDNLETFDPNAEWVEQTAITVSIYELAGLAIAGLVAAYLVSNAPEIPAVSAPLPIATSNVLTVTEAAQYLRVSESDIHQLIDDGRLAAARIGGSYRIAKSALDDFLTQP